MCCIYTSYTKLINDTIQMGKKGKNKTHVVASKEVVDSHKPITPEPATSVSSKVTKTITPWLAGLALAYGTAASGVLGSVVANKSEKFVWNCGFTACLFWQFKNIFDAELPSRSRLLNAGTCLVNVVNIGTETVPTEFMAFTVILNTMTYFSTARNSEQQPQLRQVG